MANKRLKPLKDIQEKLHSVDITWEGVDKAFYGKTRKELGKEYKGTNFVVLVNSTLDDIRGTIERRSNLIYFPMLYDINFNEKPWSPGEERFGFTSRSFPRINACIYGVNEAQADILPEHVLNELDPYGKDLNKKADRIQFGGATNNVYNYTLHLNAESLNPRHQFVDAFDGIISLLQHLDFEKSPYWFCDSIKNHPQGIKFPDK